MALTYLEALSHDKSTCLLHHQLTIMSEKLAENFEALYREFYPLLRRITRQMIRDEDASHDLTQDIFLKLWAKREELEHILDKKAYLTRAAVNSAIRYLEKNKAATPLPESLLSSGPSAMESYAHKELAHKVELVIDSLAPKCRAVFVLSRFENLKNKEIAGIMVISLKTV